MTVTNGLNLSFLDQPTLESIPFASLGSNVLIDSSVRFLNPHLISIGDNVRIDAYTIIVASNEPVTFSNHIHIGPFCLLAASSGLSIHDFSGLSAGVKIFTASDDYSGHYMTNPTVPDHCRKLNTGAVVLEKHVIIGANSTVLPNSNLGEGVAIGANSLVTHSLSPWQIYSGIPARKVSVRSKNLLSFVDSI